MAEPPEQTSFADVENWEVPPVKGNVVQVGSLSVPIWTETKAQLIENYLRLFLFITKHGIYIDGFAGPQDPSNPSSWAAKLTVELAPTWLTHFFLCEQNKQSFRKLEKMIESQPDVKKRVIALHRGDFNEWIDYVLRSGAITDKTATFALLDQRSIECKWSTVEKLAGHKQSNKIELFYFYPSGWIHRTIAGSKSDKALDEWYGGEGWRELVDLPQPQTVDRMLSKFQQLGYLDVKHWPIYQRQDGVGRTMYYMIHATDHQEAPKLMYRAYRNLVNQVPAGEQIPLL